MLRFALFAFLRTTDLRGRQYQSGSHARARISPSRRFKQVQFSPPSVLR
jgi:hypothetical protein